MRRILYIWFDLQKKKTKKNNWSVSCVMLPMAAFSVSWILLMSADGCVGCCVVVSTTGSKSWLSSLHVNATNTDSKSLEVCFVCPHQPGGSYFHSLLQHHLSHHRSGRGSVGTPQNYLRKNISPLAMFFLHISSEMSP